MRKKFHISSKEVNIYEIFNEFLINKFFIIFISILFMLLFHFKSSFDSKKFISLVTIQNPPTLIFNYYDNIIKSKNSHLNKQVLKVEILNNASSNSSLINLLEKNLYEQYTESFNLNLLSLINLNKYFDQNKEIDDFKYFLKEKNLSAIDYFRNQNFGLNKKNILINSNLQQYFITLPIELKNKNFLADYIEFTKTVTLIDFTSNLKIHFSNIITDYKTALESSKKINLEYPVKVNNVLTEHTSNDLVFKGSIILSEEIFILEKTLKSLSHNQFNYNPIYDLENNKKFNSSRFPLWLNNLGGLVLGFFLSLMIILFRYILKKNN